MNSYRPICNWTVCICYQHMNWQLAAKKHNEFLNCFVTRGPITCLCTRALSTLATPLAERKKIHGPLWADPCRTIPSHAQVWHPVWHQIVISNDISESRDIIHLQWVTWLVTSQWRTCNAIPPHKSEVRDCRLACGLRSTAIQNLRVTGKYRIRTRNWKI